MMPIIDTNVYLGTWPFRQLPLGDAAELVAKLKVSGVTQAWAGSFEGLFHRDLAGVNERLARTCAQLGGGMLVPVGSINPTLPDWEQDISRCQETHQMIGIRLHPNYHGYKLSDAGFARLLDAATERKLIVQLVVSIEDERTQNPVFRVPHVDCGPLAELVKARPKLRLVALNAFRAMTTKQIIPLAESGQVWFDIATLEGAGGVGTLVRAVGLEHLVFGSFAPLFYLESALLKLRESELAGLEVQAILSGNARKATQNS